MIETGFQLVSSWESDSRKLEAGLFDEPFSRFVFPEGLGLRTTVPARLSFRFGPSGSGAQDLGLDLKHCCQ